MKNKRDRSHDFHGACGANAHTHAVSVVRFIVGGVHVLNAPLASASEAVTPASTYVDPCMTLCSMMNVTLV
jgi:hypothetical protein